MNFYQSIRPWYDEIFPYSEAQRDFVLSFGADPALSVIDVGCGTGSLIVALAATFRKTAGLDPDPGMLETARHKASLAVAGTWFFQAGMLDLVREFSPASADRLICFGNTIPHLDHRDQLDEMLAQAHAVLSQKGMILLQIINFKWITRNKLPGLPTLENDHVRFVRNYRYVHEEPDTIGFHTILTIKSTGQTIENEIPLLAITDNQLIAALDRSGFRNLKSFGNFKGDPFHPDSQPFIITAEKG